MPLPRPLMVVVGLPPTGTTLLQTLLGCDPDAVVLPFWQLRRPYPIPRRRLEAPQGAGPPRLHGMRLAG
jgi:hypothetical protein